MPGIAPPTAPRAAFPTPAKTLAAPFKAPVSILGFFIPLYPSDLPKIQDHGESSILLSIEKLIFFGGCWLRNRLGDHGLYGRLGDFLVLLGLWGRTIPTDPALIDEPRGQADERDNNSCKEIVHY
jgi:hypothetical protein